MKNQTTTKQYRYDPDFVDFRNHVNTMLYDLNIYAYQANHRGDFFVEGCINQMCKNVKQHAVAFFNDVMMEDDEYGTLGYTGYARSWRQAKEQFLDWLDEYYGIRPTYYEGDLNGYLILVDNLCERIAHYCLSPNKYASYMYEEEENDEDLPF